MQTEGKGKEKETYTGSCDWALAGQWNPAWIWFTASGVTFKNTLSYK